MKQIDDNLLAIFNTMTRDREDWKYVTDIQKENNFFIINRFMSKRYPDKAQLFNLKVIDKISALNIWYYFLINKPYPKWFWSKNSIPEKSEISEKDYKLLLRKLNIKDIDLDYLINKNMEFIKEELKYYKQIEKGN